MSRYTECKSVALLPSRLAASNEAVSRDSLNASDAVIYSIIQSILIKA